jgi:hypothetical protein
VKRTRTIARLQEILADELRRGAETPDSNGD